MTVMPVGARPSFSMPSEHLEQLSRGAAALTLDPYLDILHYIFPCIGAYFSSYSELKLDPSQQAMMPPNQVEPILREIEDLTACAGIRKVTPYTALNHQFASYGGICSLTTPALLMPDQHLFRRNQHSSFGQERPDEDLRNNLWIYSDHETRFLIARELGQLKEMSPLLRIAIKVSVIATLFIIYASPFSWPVGLALFIGTIGLYIISEKFFQAKADLIGAEILSRRLESPAEAKQIAIDTLEKMRQQNLYRRSHSTLAPWYITSTGNNMLDFRHPYLTTRINALRAS